MGEGGVRLVWEGVRLSVVDASTKKEPCVSTMCNLTSIQIVQCHKAHLQTLGIHLLFMEISFYKLYYYTHFIISYHF